VEEEEAERRGEERECGSFCGPVVKAQSRVYQENLA